MTTISKQIELICDFVSAHGKLTHQAQNIWGMDTYELNGITIGLGDAGYTQSVRYNNELDCWQTIGLDVKFNKGNATILHSIYVDITRKIK